MRFYRQFAVRLLLAVVSTTSLLGSGLHLLPGCNHFHDQGHSSDANAECGAFHLAHHGFDDCKSDSDCPICRFLAIPWAVTLQPQIIDCGRRIECLVAASTPRPAIEVVRLYGARAPPS